MIILSPLNKALSSLQAALAQPKNEFVRDAVIQRFEYTYELAWKMLKRHLGESEGAAAIDPLSRKDLFRMGGERGIIENVEAWLAYHRARNETSHTYDESKAEQVYDVARQFAGDAEKLLRELERRNA
ncbi:MAG: nucleotidyltransferase substrate binding protein [Sulfurimicrobium sp.]|jgi:nucleotidyltransferase substrate binding protein (TIGR01987 family)|nr:nucleotidyltransferase substrate binding protein [Sulfurimicrobium sp.]